MTRPIDLNSDVGESFGRYSLGLDEEVIPLISSANIACGFHAGDPAVMRRTVGLAKTHGKAVGAHPGLPDLRGFGRRTMEVTLEEIQEDVAYQVGALQAFASLAGMRLQHVKPHGALYNMAGKNPHIWETVGKVMAQLDPNLILVVLAGPNRKELQAMAHGLGIRMAFEFFADRAYAPDGSLAPRKEPGAVIHNPDQVADRIVKVVREGVVTTIQGQDIPMQADTICVHGDNPRAVALVKRIGQVLDEAGIPVAPMGSFL